MSTITQSVVWWCYVPGKLTAQEFIRAVVDIGYPAIDLVPPDYWNAVLDHGLSISAVAGHQPLEIGLNRVDLHDRLQDEIQTSIEHAKRLRIPNVICFSGNRDGLDDAKGLEATATGFARVAPYAEEVGVTLVLELLNSFYDIYHMQIMEGDIIRTIRANHGMIGEYHTAGNPGRHELDQFQEIHYPPILQAIKETGYSGYIAHEFVPKGDPIASLRTAFQQCAPLL